MKRSFAYTQSPQTSTHLKASVRFAQLFLAGIILSSLILTMGRVLHKESIPASPLKAQAVLPESQ